MLLLILSATALALVLYFCIDLILGHRTIERLAACRAISAPEKVSIIVPARNEEVGIERALQSLLNLDYSNKEIIVINDRSTDETGVILNRMQRRNPDLTVIHVENLPDGWLGKNHAMAIGAAAAGGEWLLFTDADVMFERATLGRAANYVRVHSVDHLAALPNIHARGFWVQLFVAYFTMYFSMFFKPWKACDPQSDFHIGIGAFNLIRADVYKKIGTHGSIAMRPDDDMKLGKLVKQSGFRQCLVAAHDLISVEWYSSVREMMKGLEKNAYAGLNYSLWMTIAGVAGQFMCFVMPFVLAIFAVGPIQWISVITVGVLATTFVLNQAYHRAPAYHLLSWPAASLFIISVMLNGMFKVLIKGGIEWRGTVYSTESLLMENRGKEPPIE